MTASLGDGGCVQTNREDDFAETDGFIDSSGLSRYDNFNEGNDPQIEGILADEGASPLSAGNPA